MSKFAIPYPDALPEHGAACGLCHAMQIGVGEIGVIESERCNTRGEPIVYLEGKCWFSRKHSLILEKMDG